MENIIINVDDFGLSRAFNHGIVDGYKAGVISSTTLLVTSLAVDHAVELAKENPGLGVGLHLALTSFKSITEHEEISENGYLLNQLIVREKAEEINQEAIYQELKAQLELFIAKMGKKPTHLDMHHHMHHYQNIKEVVIKLANEYHLLLRNEETEAGKSVVNIDFYDPQISFEQYQKSINELLGYDKNINRELCVHAGYIDQLLMDVSGYNLARIKELSVLLSPECREFTAEKQIKLVPFS